MTRGSATRPVGPMSLLIDSALIDSLANAILALPPVMQSNNARERLRAQAAPVRTLSALWYRYIVCGFSTQENSEKDSRLGRFVRADGPLLHLAAVAAHSGDPAWVEREVRLYGFGKWDIKRTLVTAAYPLFMEAGRPDDMLTDLCRAGGALKLFCDLARGEVSDRDLTLSAGFSAGINATPFHQIGEKQIRNILVNTGLAHNIVPLDSRWKTFFAELLVVTPKVLANRNRYLAIENALRSALLLVRERRPDIANLAILDAIVFEHMSKQGIDDGGWLAHAGLSRHG